MKKKIIIICGILAFIFISSEMFFFIDRKANTSIDISGQNSNVSNKNNVLLYINNKKISTINLNHHFAYHGKHNLFFGKNEISIKDVNFNIVYETEIYFFGLYNWNLIEFTEKGFTHDKYFLPPTYE